jgi:ssDNA-binding Zn-finger/Zn-ribbon topoisomerase 1
MSDILPQMIEALQFEVAAIRKKGGGTQIELHGGEQIGQVEGAWLYKFVVSEDLNLRDDTPIRVMAGKEDVAGVLVSFRDGVLLVALEENLGLKIATARLVANDAFLIERLKETLEKVRDDNMDFSRPSAERVLGMIPPRTADAEPHPSVLRGDGANDDQILAVRRSLGSDTTYIWGPPGTGKTTTLARIVEAHYKAGRSVLLVSNTNIAVDTALERVAERLKGEAEFHQGLVIRQGPVVKEELRQRFGPQVVLEEIVSRLSGRLREEKEVLGLELASLEKEERSLEGSLAKLVQLSEAHQKLAAREKFRDAVRSESVVREREAERYHAGAVSLRAELKRAKEMGKLRRLLSGLNVEKLARRAELSELAAQVSAESTRVLAADLLRYESALAELRTEIDRLSAQTGHYPPATQLEKNLEALRIGLTQLRERIMAIDRELEEVEKQVLARCRILATTVYRTYLGKSASRQYDAVVIDEASMLMPPLVYYAAGLATQSVIVAGDFRQLPPIVMSDEPLAEKWLKQDVFEKAHIPERLRRGQPTPHLVPLRIQYRMREAICAVTNELFYADHPLRSDVCVSRGMDDFPLSKAPLLYVDTTTFHPWAALRVGTYSRYNLFHALLVRNIVLHLAETEFLPPAGQANNAVGVVAPYASQARLIQALLDDRLGPRAAGIAATVHRFQGNEKRVMLLDLTDSVGVRLGRFLRATSLEEDGARLLNVATSRAKQHVVLLANFGYLRGKAPADCIVRRLVDLFEEHGEALGLGTLLPLAERDWVDGLHRVFPATFDLPDGAAGAFTEGTFYPTFLKDLGRARESIVILSPFATERGTGRWADPVRAAIARGVRVRILTRPADDSVAGNADDVAELVHSMRDLGVAVDLRAGMHEKIAILDGRILWHGSLNILSHRDTHESMLRIESSAACSQLARFFSTPVGRHEHEAERSFDRPENPECPKCAGPMVWNNGRFGVYFECENADCDGKLDARGGSRSSRSAATIGSRGRERTRGLSGQGPAKRRACPEPGCSGLLRERNGRRGRFLGCSEYPTCRHTENLP